MFRSVEHFIVAELVARPTLPANPLGGTDTPVITFHTSAEDNALNIGNEKYGHSKDLRSCFLSDIWGIMPQYGSQRDDQGDPKKCNMNSN